MSDSADTQRAIGDDREPSLIDFDSSLRRLGGDMALFREFIGYFEEDAPQLLNDLSEAIRSEEASAAQRAAHSIKGLAANFGGEKCVAVASEMESLVKSQEFAAAADHLDSLETEVAKLENELRLFKAK